MTTISRPMVGSREWDLLQAFYPHLFDGPRLKYGITAQDLLKPFEGRDVTPTYERLFKRLIEVFPDHFASPDDCKRIQNVIGRPLDVRPLVNTARRFDSAGAFAIPSRADRGAVITHQSFGEHTTRRPTAREAMALEYIAKWMDADGESMPSFAEALRRKRRFTLGDVCTLLFKLIPEDHERVFALLEREGLTRMFPLPPKVESWIERAGAASTPSPLIDDPVATLKEALNGEGNEQLLVRVYIRAFIRRLAEPSNLIRLIGALPRGLGLLAPLLPGNSHWPELIAFLARHGSDEDRAAAWYDSLRHHEPQFEGHLKIAFASRLKPLFMDAWRALDRRAYIEDVLKTISLASGLEPADVAAWLSWQYVGDDRKMVGSLLSEHTMIGWQFDQLRSLPYRPCLATECERVQHVLREARNRRSRDYTKAGWREAIERELKQLGMTLPQLQEQLRRGDAATGYADPEGAGWLAMTLGEAGIVSGAAASVLRGALPHVPRFAPAMLHPHSFAWNV